MLLLRDTLMSLLFATGFSSACQFKIDIEIFFNESREKSLNPNVKFEKRQQTKPNQYISILFTFCKPAFYRNINFHGRLVSVRVFSFIDGHYLNNRVFLSRNYRLIVAPRKFDVLKTNICPRSEAWRANMLVLRTPNFQGATSRSTVPRLKHSIVFFVQH